MTRVWVISYRLNRKARCEGYPTQHEALEALAELKKNPGVSCSRVTPFTPEGAYSVPPHHLGSMLISAVRYALGRQTYIVAETCHMVKFYMKHLDHRDLIVMAKDIQRAENKGDDCDSMEWQLLHSEILSHLSPTESKEVLTC